MSRLAPASRLVESDGDGAALPPRVVSLIASATEIVYALGCGDWLVGRSHECDYPPEVVRLPACSAARIDVHADSSEIDRQVKAALTDSGGVYRLEIERLEDLRPSVVLTQHQCDVCAVSLSDVQAAVCEFGADRPQVVSLQPNSLADVWNDIRRVGAALGVPERAEALLDQCLQRLNALRQAIDCSAPPQPRVACLEWLEPLMAAGNWMPELVELAGGVNLFGLAGQHSPWLSWNDLVTADPEVIVLLPCGFDLPRTLSESHWLTDRPEWRRLSAVRHRRVYAADGNQYFNRPGPRLVESVEILAEMLHPSLFEDRHRGAGWQCLDPSPGCGSPLAGAIIPSAISRPNEPC